MTEDNPFSPWMDKFNIHQETIGFYKYILSQPFRPLQEYTIEERREAMKKLVGPPMDFDGTVTNKVVDVPHLSEGVPITIYKSPRVTTSSPILLFYHGGGFMLNDLTVFDPVMKLLATDIAAILVYVEYRLLPCPEDPLAPFNDCLAVTEWLVKNKAAVGGSETSKFGISGDSAGGQTALSIVQTMKDGIDFQFVVYPIVSLNFNPPSNERLSVVPAFNAKQFEDQYKLVGLMTDEMKKNPRVNLELVDDWTTCPPTLLITTYLEPLQDLNFEFVEKLKAAKVNVEMVVMEGVPHVFFSRPYYFPEKHQEARQHILAFLKKLGVVKTPTS